MDAIKYGILYDMYQEGIKSETKESLQIPNSVKYGEFIDVNGEMFLLTNLRALFHDADRFENQSLKEWYNDSSEAQEIISAHSNVFMAKMDIATARQFNRTRISLQELSRRYVNGKKEPFEIYLSKAVVKASPYVYVEENISTDPLEEEIISVEIGVEKLMDMTIEMYLDLIKKGVPAEEARRVIPVGAYTKVWSSFLPEHMDNFYKLRTDGHAQSEIQKLAFAMQKI